MNTFPTNFARGSPLAVGLVTLNLVCVAAVAHLGIDGFSWATAFVLAAIVSPTDTTAVGAVTSTLPLPRRVERILEGESLFNDVVALVAYQQAVKAAATGTFSPGEAGWELLWDTVAGISSGVAVGMLATWARRRVHDTAANTVASLLTPFAAYIAAEAVGASGVLATVAAGLYVGHVLLASLRPAERVQTLAFWEGVRFILEGLAFVLIGFQLRLTVGSLSDAPLAELLRACALVGATVVVVRLVWMLSWTRLSRYIGPGRSERESSPPLGHAVLIGWAGMRGVDSLAAALALPLVAADGATPFPQRNLILLLSFSVILSTLVLQGLTLPLLVRRLGVPADQAIRQEEILIRLSAAKTALQKIEELAEAIAVPPEVVSNLRTLYEIRMRYCQAGLDLTADGSLGASMDALGRLMRELLKVERQVVVSMWADGLIGDEVRQRIEQTLDYEELKLLT